MTQASGTVTIAPHVLTTIVSLTAREVPGVARLVSPLRANPFVGGDGIHVQMIDGAVVVDCYLIALPEVNLLELGITVQATIAAAIRELVGYPVREVNVYIQDVEVGRG